MQGSIFCRHCFSLQGCTHVFAGCRVLSYAGLWPQHTNSSGKLPLCNGSILYLPASPLCLPFTTCAFTRRGMKLSGQQVVGRHAHLHAGLVANIQGVFTAVAFAGQDSTGQVRSTLRGMYGRLKCCRFCRPTQCRLKLSCRLKLLQCNSVGSVSCRRCPGCVGTVAACVVCRPHKAFHVRRQSTGLELERFRETVVWPCRCQPQV
jgi:hypothetical protein